VTKTGQGRAEQLVSFSRSFVELGRPAKQPFSVRKPKLLQPQNPEAATRVKVSIVHPQNHLIELFGL